MKTILLYSHLLVLFLTCSIAAQDRNKYQLVLRNGSFIPEKNVGSGKTPALNRQLPAGNQKSFVIIQFEEIPSEKEREQLKNEGIELLDYIPNNAYTATITGLLQDNPLQRSKARAVIQPTARQKLHASLAEGLIPEHARKVKDYADVWINFPRSFSYEEISKALIADEYEILSGTYRDYQILEVRVREDQINELASKSYIQYVQPVPGEDKPINNNSTVNGRANVLQSSLLSGRNLHGEGIVAGVGDESNPLRHVDFSNRVINRAAIEAGGHGVHVMGTFGGAGIINEKFTGYAPKAKIVAQHYSGILAYSAAYVQDYGMVITNNSYGNDVTDCSTFGEYNLQSYILDQQAFQLPYLQHVFAAGNSGVSACGPYPTGFGNIVGGYQSAKNVISVGNTTYNAVVAPSSSRGPVKDGRIKPEITAQGTDVNSTYPVNLYARSSGTSMASPAVSGGLALLYQRYRQLHNEQNPKNGLMKALLCNGGTDQGNAGPDYKYGFGWMNLLRSVKMLESEQYRIAAVSNAATDTYAIQVPANTAALKVMLYWNDPATSVLSGKTLVNDLDLTVLNNASATIFPKLLDPAPAGVNNPATTGADHINNIEQVVIETPVAGTYQIQVKGTAINQNPQQEYFVVYDIIPVSTTLTNPIGKERFAAGDSTYISWDSFGNTSNDFTVQYAMGDNGSWNNIAGNLMANGRQLKWIFPNVATDKARVKVIQNATGQESVSDFFTIIGRPVVTLAPIQCEGYIALNWSPVAGATDYEVMMLSGDEMVPAGVTTSTSFVLSGLSKDETYWFTVRARINGNPGMRATALSRKPDSGSCTGNISDNDLKLETIVNPAASGRILTSTALSGQTEITIRIKNLDDQGFNGPLNLGYTLNGAPMVSEVATLTIPALSTADYTFTAKANLSAPGSYVLATTVSSASDPVTGNNTVSRTFDQLDNSPITLPFLDNAEAAAIQEITSNQAGFLGAARYDFTSSTDAGRLRTFVNTGMAFSGSKAFTLDTDRFYANGNTNFLDGTFNLSGYNLSHDIRLNFRYKNHGQKSHPDNKVWIRGSYSDSWIPVYDLFANQNPAEASYKLTSSIELSNLLEANGQNLTTSTQFRFGQHGDMIAADPFSGAGYTFDDIQLSIVTDDIQLISLAGLSASSCGLSSQQSIAISIRNSSDHSLTNIPVSYQLDNGAEIQEIIPSISGRSTITYTFSTRADMAAIGSYHLKIRSSLGTDSYPENNFLELDIYNNRQIASFPYLENFEASNGDWHTAGTNNTWAYGTPSSTRINKAASGTKAWKTNLFGNYKNQEISYLYSPCFDLAGMAQPTLSLSLALDIEFCQNEDCDVAYIEYSTDGNAWTRLGSKDQGTNWYNKITENNQGWSVQNYTRWHVATMALPVLNSNIRLRFVLKADPGTTREGIAIDDIHIYDNKNGIYAGGTTPAPVSQSAPANGGWIDFVQNGQLVASVNPNNQNLGATAVQAFINTASIRSNNNQYYLDRNITIKPANPVLAANATVRLYFLDSEAEKLLAASGCAGCTKPESAYELGVSKYTGANKNNEDGGLANNTGGIWSFIASSNTIKVPFDKGYYAEISVKDFSEFWFNDGGTTKNQPLPVELLSFKVTGSNGTDGANHVEAAWVTTSEINADRFEIERTAGSEALKLNQYIKIGEVTAIGNTASEQHYAFTDMSPVAGTVNYYRLKIIDRDGTFQYSKTRSVAFDGQADWTTFPNPSTGIIHVIFQIDAGSGVQIKIFDIQGNLRQKNHVTATGLEQKYTLDLSDPSYAPGYYLIEVASLKQKKTFRIAKP